MEAIAFRVEAIASRLEALVTNKLDLTCITFGVEASAISTPKQLNCRWARPLAVVFWKLCGTIASRLEAIGRLEAIASRLEAIAGRLEAIASRFFSIKCFKNGWAVFSINIRLFPSSEA